MWVEMNANETTESATVQESPGSTRLAGCNSESPSFSHKGALAIVMKRDLVAVLKKLYPHSKRKP